MVEKRPFFGFRGGMLYSECNACKQEPMSKERFRIVPASYLVLLRGGRVLLSRRFQTGWQDGQYSLPAGHLDGSETFRQAMAREAREEIGIILRPEDMRVAHMMHRYAVPNPEELRERMDAFVVAEHWEGELEILEPEKCDDLRWFPLDALPENIIPCIRVALGHIREGVTYSEFGFEDVAR